LAVADFPGIGLEYLHPVRNVEPCAGCGAPICLVQMGHVQKKVDCFRDDHPTVRNWQANLLAAEHVCMGSRQ